jgi:lysophospholipase L1-like esterase
MRHPLISVLMMVLSCLASVQAGALRVACVGDSITAGTFLTSPNAESYPARLKFLLGTNYVLTNFGVSSMTVLKQGDYSYWNDPAFKKSHDFAPDIVTILFGANDSKPQNWVYGTNFESDYRALIASYTNLPSHPRVLLLTPCPVFGNGVYDINPGVVATNILPQVRKLADELGLELVDINTLLSGRRDWFYDPVHPNTRGATVMAAYLYTAVTGSKPAGQVPNVQLTRSTLNRSVLSWPAEWAGCVLQLNPTISSNSVWVVDSDVGVSDGTLIRTTNATSTLYRAYRLWKP